MLLAVEVWVNKYRKNEKKQIIFIRREIFDVIYLKTITLVKKSES